MPLQQPNQLSERAARLRSTSFWALRTEALWVTSLIRLLDEFEGFFQGLLAKWRQLRCFVSTTRVADVTAFTLALTVRSPSAVQTNDHVVEVSLDQCRKCRGLPD